MTPLQKELLSLADPSYRDFTAPLIPTVDRSRILGVRTPVLRAFAKEFALRPEKERFLAGLPHVYYEENNLHAFLLEKEKDFDALIQKLEAFLPHVDNWATCDSLHPKIFSRNRERLVPILRRWLKSAHEYEVRFAMGVLMKDCMKEGFSPEHPALVAGADNGSYYLSMMTAWYMATALSFHRDEILPFFTEHRLRPETEKRAIRKAIESFRISDGLKAVLRNLNKTKSEET